MQDLIRIGAYMRGSSPQIDKAIELLPRIEKFLKQEPGERSTFAQTAAGLLEITSGWNF